MIFTPISICFCASLTSAVEGKIRSPYLEDYDKNGVEELND
jgi:hypothetical protein